MKAPISFLTAVALALAACGEPASTGDAESKPAAAATGEAPATAVAAVSADTVTPEFMTGKWALESDGDCALSQEFKADGTVDGLYDSWKLEGGNLVAGVAGETMTIAVRKIDDKHIEATVNGKTQRMVRC